MCSGMLKCEIFHTELDYKGIIKLEPIIYYCCFYFVINRCKVQNFTSFSVQKVCKGRFEIWS